MRETFTAFPEILFLDATYKLLDLQFPVYLFVCEDSNGASEIIGMGMLVTEDRNIQIEKFSSNAYEIGNGRQGYKRARYDLGCVTSSQSSNLPISYTEDIPMGCDN